MSPSAESDTPTERLPRRSGLAADPWRYGYLLLIVLHVAVLWAVAWVPTQDGPCHLENAVILAEYRTHPPYGANFEINTAPVPNWFSHVSLAALTLVVSPVIAERLFLT